MSRFNTGNPLGSGSPLDLDDNAKNFDEAINTEDPNWVDRFGRFRMPVMEQERQFLAGQAQRDDQFQSAQSSREAVFSDFLQASGYQDLGEYAPGIEITAHNQYVTFGGQPYLLRPSIPVPYTTSGEWTGDDFKLIGDDSLRQDLSNPDIGAAMVARAPICVDSISELMDLPSGQRKEGVQYSVASYYGGWAVAAEYVGPIGGGEFYWQSSDLSARVAVDTLSGVYVAPTSDPTGASGAWVRQEASVLRPEMFGGSGSNGLDNRPVFSAIRNILNIFGGGTIELMPGGVYTTSVPPSGWVPPALDLPDNTTIEGRGASIVTSSDVFEYNYSLIRVNGSKDCTVRNLILVGNKDYGGGTREDGHGIASIGSENLTLENVTCHKMGGDGLYVGTRGGGAEPTKNLNIKNFKAAECRRQGMSVINVDGLYIDGIDLSGISGANPQSGIDFEPNHPHEVLKNVRIRGVTVSECTGAGVQFHFNYLDDTSEPVDIQINGLDILNCGEGLRFQLAQESLRGNINFYGVTKISGTTGAALEYRDFAGVSVDINHLIVDTDIREPIGIGTNQSPPEVAEGMVTADLNIKRLDLNSTHQGSTYAAGVRIRGVNQGILRDVSIGIGDMVFAYPVQRGIWFDQNSPIEAFRIVQAYRGAGVKTITSSGAYNPSDHHPEYVLDGLVSFTVSTLLPGMSIKVRTNTTNRNLNLPAGSGMKFHGGTLETPLVLNSRDSYVVLERLVNNPDTIRVVEGFDYTVA